MENRKQAILRAVVHEFTTNAVPVGSQALQSRYFVNLSSATIRSELAELSDLGYLTQPHTSAGRMPTDSGYRYFVDFLMDLEPIPDRIKGFIADELRSAPADVQGMVERVAMTVAAVTQNASVASAPQGSMARIKHLDLVSLEPKEVLLILLLEGNLLRQQVIATTEPATQTQLTRLTARLNSSLGGRASDEARRHYDSAPLGLEKELLGRVIAVLDIYEKGSESLVVHDGVRNLLRHPEFAESSRVTQVLDAALAEGRDRHLRLAADFDNYKKRMRQEQLETMQHASADLIGRLLPVLDDLRNVLEHQPEGIDQSWIKGLELSVRKLEEALGAHGLQPIDSVGERFDPKVHEAVGHEESTEHPEDTVVSELRRGYRVRDRVVRPALVKVARPPALPADSDLA